MQMWNAEKILKMFRIKIKPLRMPPGCPKVIVLFKINTVDLKSEYETFRNVIKL